MQYTIQIPKPCHESWDKMIPDQDGRHCAQCSKTVIDFTGWQQEDILTYMQQQGAGKVCGRFRAEQLNTPISAGEFVIFVHRSPLPFYKQIAAIFLFAFGMLHMSNDANAQTTTKQKPTPPPVKHVIMGKPAPRPPVIKDTMQKAKHRKPSQRNHHIMGGPMAEPYPDHLMGDVAIEPVHRANDSAKKK